MKNKMKKLSEQGSMMVEALAMLGLITMVTPILYKKAAERTTELQDINAATQLRTLSGALDSYIKDNYGTISEGAAVQSVSSSDIEPYLPYNFNLNASKLFDQYKFALHNRVIGEGDTRHSAITGLVLAPTLGELPMIRASKIASMVGANGGVVQNGVVQGVQGGWKSPLSEFNLGGNVDDGSLAMSSVHAVTTAGVADLSHVLFRDNSRGINFNTMSTTLYMGGEDLADVTNLIAKEGNMYLLNGTTNVGKSGAPQDLYVWGDANIKNNLNVDKDANITGTLTAGAANILQDLHVGGDTTMDGNLTVAKKLEVHGGATIDGGDIQLGDSSHNVKIDGNNVDINAQNNLNMSGDNVNVTAQNDLHMKSENGDVYVEAPHGDLNMYGDNVNVTAQNDLHMKSENGDIYMTTPNGDVNINDVHITNEGDIVLPPGGEVVLQPEKPGDPTGFHADYIHAHRGLGAGGGNMNDASRRTDGGNFNFWATDSIVHVKNPNFVVGSTDVASGRLGVTSSETYMRNGSSKVSVTTDETEIVGSKNIEAYAPTVNLYESGDKSGLFIDKNKMTLQNNAGGNPTAEVYLDDTKLQLGAKPSRSTARSFIELTNLIKMSSKNIGADEENLIFGQDLPEIGTTDWNNEVKKEIRTSGVRVNRRGIVQLPRGTYNSGDNTVGKQETAGYAKLDRILSNKELESDALPSAPSKKYDAYQVNPAYTSVMHDIKLTTRGGARLSDILPDFINKGIYVLDNTYKETGWDWGGNVTNIGSNGTPVGTGLPGECSSSDGYCTASPWLGVVPTPLCPPGYSKVITINPVRWKMADTFHAKVGEPPTSGSYGEKFRNYFEPVYDPRDAFSGFELEYADGTVGTHTHEVKSFGTMLTYQTNTWLNTTVDKISNGGVFKGWSAIMGFLYDGNLYSSVYSGAAGKIIWNLFPVYQQELSAIANVYCYFERRPSGVRPNFVDGLNWNSALVDTKDQLTSFRSGIDNSSKANSAYTNRLNDPTLGYDDVW